MYNVPNFFFIILYYRKLSLFSLLLVLEPKKFSFIDWQFSVFILWYSHKAKRISGSHYIARFVYSRFLYGSVYLSLGFWYESVKPHFWMFTNKIKSSKFRARNKTKQNENRKKTVWKMRESFKTIDFQIKLHTQPNAHQKLTWTAYIYKCWANNAYA